jgi:hypothetical protein
VKKASRYAPVTNPHDLNSQVDGAREIEVLSGGFGSGHASTIPASATIDLSKLNLMQPDYTDKLHRQKIG